MRLDSNLSVKLHLFLAKTEGVWLTEVDVKKGVSDASGLTPLDIVRAKLRRVGLSDEQMTKQPEMALCTCMVVVPDQGTLTPIVSPNDVFDHCSGLFFSQFFTVDQVGDWIEFSSLLLLTRRQKLYIRSSYRVIADQALLNADGNMVKYAVVTGTPGIGKSVFVYYVMWSLIKDK
ncbi:Crinkler (CRN) [Phytophthora megakarya]|uniref:Crinkler (CRN) n=1 Tax=Phytophthora megakarya TaxID=4795 RepID=A0A225X203_9STRA|nr:Crinkler (CRN) [Phytophthora megakarya]